MKDTQRLTALVTGASRGIGRAVAAALAARSVRLAIHYQKSRDGAEETRRALSGSDHVLCQADLEDVTALRGLWEEAVERLGHLDILVNNAGVYIEHPPLEADALQWEESWRRTLAINLVGPAHLGFLAARHMAERGGGRIVNISSRGAFRGEPLAPAYGASKAGLNAMGQSLAKGLASRNVLVFTIAPGWVETDMATGSLAGPQGAAILADQPLGRIARPEEIAATAAFCALDAPQSLTGAVLDVNGASYLRS
jgi:3-oxoacyl-[acyl-carrier protein] reductase